MEKLNSWEDYSYNIRVKIQKTTQAHNNQYSLSECQRLIDYAKLVTGMTLMVPIW